jgi:transposase
LDYALTELPRPGAKPRLDGKQEAYLVALACSDAPDGRNNWTMQLLANKLVQLNVVEEISDETVRRVLKKMNSSLG